MYNFFILRTCLKWNCVLVVGCLFVLLGGCAGERISRVETLAGTGEAGTVDGPALEALLDNPFGVVRGPEGALWFCEYDGHTVRRIDAEGRVSTIVGNGKAGYGGDGGPAIEAKLNRPHEIRFDKEGRLYIADMKNQAIRRVDLETGIITTVAGTGKIGFWGDGGLAIKAKLRQPHSIQFGPGGRLFIADVGNHRVRVVDMDTGIIETFAGDGFKTATEDGADFAKVSLFGPRSLDFDKQGNMWLALRNGNQVYRLDLGLGTIHHIAGTGEKGFGGNGGDAKLAQLSGPKGIAISEDGEVYVVDTESHSIRRISLDTGIIDVVLGTGEAFDGADGDPLQCGLARPHGIFIDRDGSLLIGDSENHKIRVLRF